MQQGFRAVAALCMGLGLGAPVTGTTIYNNLTPNSSMAMATRPGVAGQFEIESADDFVVTDTATVNSASFVGLFVPGTGGSPSISDVTIEMYRVFPLDSNTIRTITVPTRANSPSDVAFATRDSAASELTFGSVVLNGAFSSLNSVTPGGIHPSPGQTTTGNGPLMGQEVQINVTFSTPFTLPANHYFFVPQVTLTNGGQFYWLSASRPISGAGTTPFPAGFTDLQAWTRDANLDPDWLRVGTDIVGGATPPTFNAAFSLDGTVQPEPESILTLVSGLAFIGFKLLRRAEKRRG